ncbi:hypothetical protein [Thioflexithrix psekupsensis]|uniref:Uncharacterized protein n=1 Tax=Thioflexithrix psekupsensis TaxID=1570016 RepID=A0A251X675_9GAMM|nr:hypothetical protein [Thioflexithrix psekupsensis]OUD13122.1 hypothetical protein TPSD3_10775 [Thioflexithrix psekupsensis]
MKNKYLRTAAAATNYTEIFCLDCEQVVGLEWALQHHNTYLPNTEIDHLSVCPMCGGGRVMRGAILPQDFEAIAASWDLMAAGETEISDAPSRNEQDNIVDLSHWFEAGQTATCNKPNPL